MQCSKLHCPNGFNLMIFSNKIELDGCARGRGRAGVGALLRPIGLDGSLSLFIFLSFSLSLTHTLSHTHTHTRTHTNSLSHTHTHTHTWTRACGGWRAVPGGSPMAAQRENRHAVHVFPSCTSRIVKSFRSRRSFFSSR